MSEIDFKQLSHSIQPDTSRVPYNESRHLFTKVAFDLFKLNDSEVESYWQLETGDDGQEYLVAKYEDEGDLEAKGSDWQAISDKRAQNVTVFYKGTPVRRCTASEFGFGPDSVHLFTHTLKQGLTKNASLVSKMLNELPEEKRKNILSQFPELKQ